MDLPVDKLEQSAKLLDKLLTSIPKDLGTNHFVEQDVLAEANWISLKEDTSVNRGIDIAESMLEAWAHHKSMTQYYEKRDYVQNAQQLEHAGRNILFEKATQYTLLLLPGQYEVQAPETLTPISDETWAQLVVGMEAWQGNKKALKPVELDALILEPHVETKVKKQKNYTEMVTEVEGQWARSQLYVNTAHITKEEIVRAHV